MTAKPIRIPRNLPRHCDICLIVERFEPATWQMFPLDLCDEHRSLLETSFGERE